MHGVSFYDYDYNMAPQRGRPILVCHSWSPKFTLAPCASARTRAPRTLMEPFGSLYSAVNSPLGFFTSVFERAWVDLVFQP